MTYPPARFDFVAEVQHLLVEKGIVSRGVALSELHEHIPAEDQAVDEHHMNNVIAQFYETSEGFRQIYFDLIRYIAREFFEFDFIFQEIPNIRFHFPVRFGEAFRNRDDMLVSQHSDTMLGHSFEEINFWLPLTDCSESDSLQLSDLDSGIKALSQVLEDLDWDVDRYHEAGREHYHRRVFSDDEFQRFVVESTKPVKLKVGECVAFDARCLHGPAENKEGLTRVNLDFRIIPLHRYELLQKCYRSQGRSGRWFVRGDVFFQKSARELENIGLAAAAGKGSA